MASYWETLAGSVAQNDGSQGLASALGAMNDYVQNVKARGDTLTQGFKDFGTGMKSAFDTAQDTVDSISDNNDKIVENGQKIVENEKSILDNTLKSTVHEQLLNKYVSGIKDKQIETNEINSQLNRQRDQIAAFGGDIAIYAEENSLNKQIEEQIKKLYGGMPDPITVQEVQKYMNNRQLFEQDVLRGQSKDPITAATGLNPKRAEMIKNVIQTPGLLDASMSLNNKKFLKYQTDNGMLTEESLSNVANNVLANPNYGNIDGLNYMDIRNNLATTQRLAFNIGDKNNLEFQSQFLSSINMQNSWGAINNTSNQGGQSTAQTASNNNNGSNASQSTSVASGGGNQQQQQQQQQQQAAAVTNQATQSQTAEQNNTAVPPNATDSSGATTQSDSSKINGQTTLQNSAVDDLIYKIYDTQDDAEAAKKDLVEQLNAGVPFEQTTVGKQLYDIAENSYKTMTAYNDAHSGKGLDDLGQSMNHGANSISSNARTVGIPLAGFAVVGGMIYSRGLIAPMLFGLDADAIAEEVFKGRTTTGSGRVSYNIDERNVKTGYSKLGLSPIGSKKDLQRLLDSSDIDPKTGKKTGIPNMERYKELLAEEMGGSSKGYHKNHPAVQAKADEIFSKYNIHKRANDIATRVDSDVSKIQDDYIRERTELEKKFDNDKTPLSEREKKLAELENKHAAKAQNTILQGAKDIEDEYAKLRKEEIDKFNNGYGRYEKEIRDFREQEYNKAKEEYRKNPSPDNEKKLNSAKEFYDEDDKEYKTKLKSHLSNRGLEAEKLDAVEKARKNISTMDKNYTEEINKKIKEHEEAEAKAKKELEDAKKSGNKGRIAKAKENLNAVKKKAAEFWNNNKWLRRSVKGGMIGTTVVTAGGAILHMYNDPEGFIKEKATNGLEAIGAVSNVKNEINAMISFMYDRDADGNLKYNPEWYKKPDAISYFATKNGNELDGDIPLWFSPTDWRDRRSVANKLDDVLHYVDDYFSPVDYLRDYTEERFFSYNKTDKSERDWSSIQDLYKFAVNAARYKQLENLSSRRGDDQYSINSILKNGTYPNNNQSGQIDSNGQPINLATASIDDLNRASNKNKAQSGVIASIEQNGRTAVNLIVGDTRNDGSMNWFGANLVQSALKSNNISIGNKKDGQYMLKYDSVKGQYVDSKGEVVTNEKEVEQALDGTDFAIKDLRAAIRNPDLLLLNQDLLMSLDMNTQNGAVTFLAINNDKEVRNVASNFRVEYNRLEKQLDMAKSKNNKEQIEKINARIHNLKANFDKDLGKAVGNVIGKLNDGDEIEIQKLASQSNTGENKVTTIKPPKNYVRTRSDTVLSNSMYVRFLNGDKNVQEYVMHGMADKIITFSKLKTNEDKIEFLFKGSSN